jgi:short-subunit dehydrogenase
MKNIIVTGASKGVGYALVRAFAGAGTYRVFAISRNRELLKNLEQVCNTDITGSEVHTFALDLASGNLQEELIPEIKKNGGVDILVNNAGLLINKPIGNLTEDDFDAMFNTNIKSVFRLINTILPHLNKNAHIVNISSMGGYQGSVKFPGLSLYSASKGALAIFTECLAEELKERNIFANCLALGAVQTEMLQEAFPGYQAPLDPGQMATFIMEFALSGHRYFNGKILPVSLSTP